MHATHSKRSYHTARLISWAVSFPALIILAIADVRLAEAQLQAPSPRFGGATGRPAGGQQGVSLQFPDNTIDDILAIYEKLIGKPIVKDSSVREGPNVSLVTPNQVQKDEAISLIEATLLVNGYVLVTEPESNKVTILRGGNRAGGESPSFSEGTTIYTNPEDIPTGDSLVGFFMTLDYISPLDAATIFQNHISFNDFGKMTPVSSPQGLLITETSPIVRSLIRLRTIIDRPVHQAPLLTEFVPLEHAEANIVAQIIQAAMDARMVERERQQELQAQSGQSGQGQNNQQRQTNNNSRSQQSNNRVTGIGTADQPAAQLIPDDRLNRIMVVASPSDAAYILELIREFDQPLDSPTPVERSLQYVKANDILPVIVDILQDTGTGETQLPGGRQIDTRPQPVTSSQLATLTGAAGNAQNNQNRTNNQDAEVVGGRTDQIAFPIDEVAPISVLVGKTRIIADRQANSIIIVGGKESQRVVMDMIDRLDRRPVQVYLATVIGEMTLSDDVAFGVDYIQRFDGPGQSGLAGGLFARRTDIVSNNNIPDASSMFTSPTNPFGPANGLNLYGHVNSSLDTIITALETTERFKVLSRPVVYTQNGKRAEITSGQEVPVPVNTLTDTNNINAVQTSIEFKEVVLKLEVLPIINDNDEVTLDIVQINDRVVGNQLVANNSVPIIGKQELNTTVQVANRSTIVLGGLITESNDKDETGVPLLSRIPVLGHAAKNSQDVKRRTELMIFIQPVVVHCDDEAVLVTYDEDVRSDVGHEAATIFPEPGVPTLQQRSNVIEEQILETKPIKRLGQKIFGKKKQTSRTPPPIVATPVYQ